jgi:hypothetical protein
MFGLYHQMADHDVVAIEADQTLTCIRPLTVARCARPAARFGGPHGEKGHLVERWAEGLSAVRTAVR